MCTSIQVYLYGRRPSEHGVTPGGCVEVLDGRLIKELAHSRHSVPGTFANPHENGAHALGRKRLRCVGTDFVV